ncbi:hypothetical protein M409DRAFT_21295 [Zasmidium cellare ATCC 36951]|uniref:SnoaL-like domain-containing protein n=1 Tax=Zasmidium cellare ATCC 36951 TaxID=1080233 RepID=A0A6A6CN20_ZASCE|nr:uncharacterized protein M409DRAFT_21295 [Zasmidium cellare ATCC 36951]KAF2168544.1 hypothetical protein M409DRAFT_21295 [Zasmidium cellare ATCC 36951]
MHNNSTSKQHHRQQDPPPSTTGPYTPSPTTTSDLLISHTTLILHNLNTRHYTPQTYTALLSPHLRIDCNSQISTGIPHAIAAYKWVADINPRFHVAVIEATPIVHEESGRATVLCGLSLTNCSDGTVRAGSLSTSWSREKGVGWRCWNFEIFFGIREFF